MPSRSRIVVLQVSVVLIVVAVVFLLHRNDHQLHRFKGRSKPSRLKSNGVMERNAFHTTLNLTREIPSFILERRRLADVKEYYAKVGVSGSKFASPVYVTSTIGSTVVNGPSARP